MSSALSVSSNQAHDRYTLGWPFCEFYETGAGSLLFNIDTVFFQVGFSKPSVNLFGSAVAHLNFFRCLNEKIFTYFMEKFCLVIK
jgi:hypothetical protein